jgi:DNA-binding IclR family transcriptional regulator
MVKQYARPLWEGRGVEDTAMSGVQSIERAFAVLRVLSLGPCGVTDIAERADLPKSTVSRLLAALEAENAVSQRDAGGDYELGDGLRQLADSIGPDASMAAVVRPFLHDLSVAIGESAGFTVRVHRDVYWVDRYDQERAVRVRDRTGHYARMHTVPSGLAILAHLPPAELDAYLAEPLERVTDRTPTDPDLLRSRLGEIRECGSFWSREELEDGISSIAVPFRGPSGGHEAALYVEGPSYRFPKPGDEVRIEELVLDAAAQLSERLALH